MVFFFQWEFLVASGNWDFHQARKAFPLPENSGKHWFPSQSYETRRNLNGFAILTDSIQVNFPPPVTALASWWFLFCQGYFLHAWFQKIWNRLVHKHPPDNHSRSLGTCRIYPNSFNTEASLACLPFFSKSMALCHLPLVHLPHIEPSKRRSCNWQTQQKDFHPFGFEQSVKSNGVEKFIEG